MELPSGWASVPGSLERWLLPGLDSFLPVASCLKGAGLWNQRYIGIELQRETSFGAIDASNLDSG